MGTRDNKPLYYTLAATFIVLMLLAISGGTRGGSVWSLFKFKSGNSKQFTRADYYKVPNNKYAVVRYNDSQETSEKIYKNDYQPSANHANNYQEPQQENHPLVASTKFIGKKDKLKKAKKRNKTLAKNRKGKTLGTANYTDDDDFFEDDEETQTLNNGGTANAPAVAAGTGKSKKDEDKEMNTVEFWEKPIFIEEDFKAVVKLIESYQIRKVSNNVFYSVVDDMTHDERPNLREYGLVALSATPSAKSFTGLAWIKHNDDITNIRSNAGSEIKNYADATRLNYVLGALRSSTEETPKATIEALNVLTETTKKYSSVQQQNGNSNPSSQVNIGQLQPRLGSALLVIQEKYLNSPDPKIKSEADKTVAAINSFISL